MLLLFAALLFAVPAFGQSAILAPAENLVTEGLPEIPASIAEEVRRYTESRGAGLSSWHPVKREMLIGTRFGDTNQVHLVRFPGGDRTQLTFFSERSGGASFRPKTGEYFVFNRDVGGNEFFQFYRYDVATGDVTLLTDGKSRNTGGAWSNNGEWLAFSSTRRTGKDTDIYIVNPADPKTTRMVMQVEGGGWFAADWSPDDKKILIAEFISANETYAWILDVATGEKTLITPKGGDKIAYTGAEFSKDGKGAYVTTDKESEFQRLAYVDLATKEHMYLTDHIKWDVESFQLSRDGSMIAFVTNEDGVSRLRLLDTKTRKEMPAPKLPLGLIGSLR
ncbi:MAG: TolB family protein, partial [Pyrinomonadaceae bacterium]